MSMNELRNLGVTSLVGDFWRVFAPRPNATRREIRWNGVGAALVGFVVLGIGAAIFLAIRGSYGNDGVPRIFGLPLAAGYVLLMTGLYRTITATPPGEEKKGILASLARIVLALALTLGMLALVFFVMAAARN